MLKINNFIRIAIEKIKTKWLPENFNIQNSDIQISIPSKKIDAHYCTNYLFTINHLIKNGIQSQIFQNELKHSLLSNNQIASVVFLNGYINIKMQSSFFQTIIDDINHNEIFPNIGEKIRVNVEYCSVNPTGFLHIGHARNAIFGDALARLLEKTNHDVLKEYYVNDYGNQITILGISVWKEYAKLHNIQYNCNEINLYSDEEIKIIAKSVKEKLHYNNATIEKLGNIAAKYFLQQIKIDLQNLDINHQNWVHEKTIITSGYIEKAINILQNKNYIYKGFLEDKKTIKGINSNCELLLLKTSDFKDSSDRPLTKADGSYSYFAPDIGYHLNKIDRNFEQLICVLGADHDSYANRIKIAVQMLANSLNKKIKHNVIICQMVSFESDGKYVKFSKRTGNSIKTADFIKQIDKSILKFMILIKSPDTPFVFDYENAISLSMKNPIFYIQYAHARGCSILDLAKQINFTNKTKKNIETFNIPELQELIALLSIFQNIITESVNKLIVHNIANYCYKLAEAFHKLWQEGKIDASKRFIIEDNHFETIARLNVVKAFLKVLSNSLEILGITALNKL